ncbi:MAG: DMT family transporter [Bdellovibrionales bacterium]|nr:DMT family transporter [Bdellovibrionales bacterium]
MTGVFLLAFVVGSLGVFQNTVNKLISDGWGLPLTLVANGVVLLGASTVFFLVLRLFPEESLHPLFRPRANLAGLSWIHLLPGLFGLIVITIIPYAIDRVGATRIFIALVAAQIAASMAWDRFTAGSEISPQRLLGAGLAFAGAILAAR